MNDHYLFELVDEAVRQNAYGTKLNEDIKYFRSRKSIDHEGNNLGFSIQAGI